jgi:hypothetical protein
MIQTTKCASSKHKRTIDRKRERERAGTMYTVKSIQPEDCSEAAIQSVAKWLQSKEGNKEDERHRQREKDRSGDAECIQSKACSEAAIQSMATSTQKEEDGIGLHCF